MADVLTKEQRSYNMSRIKSRDTKPELVMREALKGLRFQYQPSIFGKPDFASKKHNIAVFIDGCFWHGCPKCYREPSENNEFWKNKISGNKKRDRQVTRRMRQDGWRVVRIWEHIIRKNPDVAARRIKRMLSNNNG